MYNLIKNSSRPEWFQPERESTRVGDRDQNRLVYSNCFKFLQEEYICLLLELI